MHAFHDPIHQAQKFYISFFKLFKQKFPQKAIFAFVI
jgi:hypothetical protein